MLSAIVVDDEAPARDELKFLLKKAGNVRVVGEAANAAEAIKQLQDVPCDVMFLDINMPDASGLKLADALHTLKRPPCVVFVSAYSEYALDAFEVKATDYLLKPVELDRLKKAIDAVQKHVSLHAKASKTKQIACEHSGKKIYIRATEIIYCNARDDYAYVHTRDGDFFSPHSLSSIEKELELFDFMRVHRSYLVNLDFAKELSSKDSSTFLHLRGTDKKVPVSRRKIAQLKKTLNTE